MNGSTRAITIIAFAVLHGALGLDLAGTPALAGRLPAPAWPALGVILGVVVGWWVSRPRAGAEPSDAEPSTLIGAVLIGAFTGACVGALPPIAQAMPAPGLPALALSGLGAVIGVLLGAEQAPRSLPRGRAVLSLVALNATLAGAVARGSALAAWLPSTLMVSLMGAAFGVALGVLIGEATEGAAHQAPARPRVGGERPIAPVGPPVGSVGEAISGVEVGSTVTGEISTPFEKEGRRRDTLHDLFGTFDGFDTIGAGSAAASLGEGDSPTIMSANEFVTSIDGALDGLDAIFDDKRKESYSSETPVIRLSDDPEA